MAYCCAHDRAAARLFSRVARRYRKRFSRRGFEPLQRELLAALEAEGVEGASLLEIGSGVGALHQYLLERGAARAVGVDLSPAMIEEARAWAAERGLVERVDYRVGDYLAFADELAPADIAILDKVICCHPQGPELVDRALARTTRLLALSYPRRHAVNRLGVRLLNGLMALARSDFRVYLHDPAVIEAVCRRRGFVRHQAGRTWLWQWEIYTRQGD